MQHLMRIDEQTEAEEHSDLHNPSHAVHEGENLLSVVHRLVSYDEACDIYCQIAVALNHLGHRECEEADRKKQNRVERSTVQFDPFQSPYGCETDSDTGQRTDGHLQEECLQ